jgi:hypothetical protein
MDGWEDNRVLEWTMKQNFGEGDTNCVILIVFNPPETET